MALTEKQIREQRRIDYETLGRFLGIAEMLAEGLIARESAANRIVEIRFEYDKQRAESGVPRPEIHGTTVILPEQRSVNNG